jgi:hypothetical protein
MKLSKSIFLVGAVVMLFSCSTTVETKNVLEETGNKMRTSGDVDGVEGLKTKLLGMVPNDANNKVMISMKPTKSDIEFIFNSEEAVEEVSSYIEKMYATMPSSGIKPGENRTEIIVYNKNTDFLKTDREGNIPGGYYSISDNYNRGRMLYMVKFVEPGKQLGFSLNCFAFIDGRWVCFPKVYRAFKL